MKVKITHTLELEEVPAKACDLVCPTKKQIQKLRDHLESITFLLCSGDPSSISIASVHLDAARKELGSIDVVLEEVHSMVSGLDEYYKQKEQEEAALPAQQAPAPPPQEQEVHTRQEVEDDKPL